MCAFQGCAAFEHVQLRAPLHLHALGQRESLQQDVRAHRLPWAKIVRVDCHHPCLRYANTHPFLLRSIAHVKPSFADDCMKTETPERCTHKLAEMYVEIQSNQRVSVQYTHPLLMPCYRPRWLSSTKMETVKALLSEDPVRNSHVPACTSRAPCPCASPCPWLSSPVPLVEAMQVWLHDVAQKLLTSWLRTQVS